MDDYLITQIEDIKQFILVFINLFVGMILGYVGIRGMVDPWR